MDIFNWDWFRAADAEKNPTREAVISAAFKEFIAGHSSFEDKSTAEMQDYYYTFRSSWLIAEQFSKKAGA